MTLTSKLHNLWLAFIRNNQEMEGAYLIDGLKWKIEVSSSPDDLRVNMSHLL